MCALLQHATGSHVVMLQLSEPIHARYCEKFSIAFVAHKSPERSANPLWEKPVYILQKLSGAADNDLFIWLDPDALVVNDERNLRDALPVDADLGMVCGLDGAYNCGVIFIRNSRRVQSFFQFCIERGNVPGTSGDQARINREVRRGTCGVTAAPLNFIWNDFKFARKDQRTSEEPVIRAWHGENKQSTYRQMKSLVDMLTIHRNFAANDDSLS